MYYWEKVEDFSTVSKYFSDYDLKDLFSVVKDWFNYTFQEFVLDNINENNKEKLIELLSKQWLNLNDNSIDWCNNWFNFSSLANRNIGDFSDRRDYEQETGTIANNLRKNSKKILDLISFIDDKWLKNTVFKTYFEKLINACEYSSWDENDLVYSDTFEELQKFPDFNDFFVDMHLNYWENRNRLNFIEYSNYEHFRFFDSLYIKFYNLLLKDLKFDVIYDFIIDNYAINKIEDLFIWKNPLVSLSFDDDIKIKERLWILKRFNLLPCDIASFNSHETLEFLDKDSVNINNIDYLINNYSNVDLDFLCNYWIDDLIFNCNFEINEVLDFLRDNFNISKKEQIKEISGILSDHTIENLEWFIQKFLNNKYNKTKTILSKKSFYWRELFNLWYFFKRFVSEESFINQCIKFRKQFPWEDLLELEDFNLNKILEDDNKKVFNLFYEKYNKKGIEFYKQAFVQDIIIDWEFSSIELLIQINWFWDLDFSYNEKFWWKYNQIYHLFLNDKTENRRNILFKLIENNKDININFLLENNHLPSLINIWNIDVFNYFFDNLWYKDIKYYAQSMIKLMSRFDLELVKRYIKNSYESGLDFDIWWFFYKKLDFITRYLNDENEKEILDIFATERNIWNIWIRCDNFIRVTNIAPDEVSVFNCDLNTNTKFFRDLIQRALDNTESTLVEVMKDSTYIEFDKIIEWAKIYTREEIEENWKRIVDFQKKYIKEEWYGKIRELWINEDRLELAIYPRYHWRNMNHPDIVEHIILFLGRYIGSWYSKYFSWIRIIPRELHKFPSKQILDSEVITKYNVMWDDFIIALHTFSVPLFFSHSSNSSLFDASISKKEMKENWIVVPGIISKWMTGNRSDTDVVSEIELEDYNYNSWFINELDLYSILFEVFNNISSLEEELDKIN